jgi:cystathionine beta-lyase
MTHDQPIVLTVPPLSELHKRRSEKWDPFPPDVLASTIAEMDYPVAEPIAQVLHDAINRHDLGYAYVATERMRHAFTGFAARRMRWEVDPGQIILIPDVMVGIIEVARVTAGTTGSIAFASPAYPPFLTELPAAGLVVHEIESLEQGRLNLQLLEAVLAQGTRVFLLANPHNPTGHTLSPDELNDIAQLCAMYDAWVIADEIHAPLVLAGATHTPWLAVSDAARERGVSLISASKSFNLAGLKAALIVTASERAREMTAQLPPMGERAGLLGVLAAEAAFADGDAWLDSVIRQLSQNRDLLVQQIPRALPSVAWTPPQASYLAWLDFRRAGLGDDPARELLMKGRVALSPGQEFGLSGTGFARLNFGTSREIVEDCIRRIAHSLGMMTGTPACPADRRRNQAGEP